MRAVEVIEFGGPEVLQVRDVPDPVAGPGEVVVDVAAADTLFLELMVRRGLGGKHFPVTPPYRPGFAVAGRVRAVGSGVDPSWVGRPVVAMTSGGYAERVAASVDGVLEVPDGLGLPEAIALFHDGSTAFGLLERTGTEEGERVVVMPAAGGLGIVLVQLARNAGATVVAAARGKKKLDLAIELGADFAVDYEQPEWEERVRDVLGGPGPDVVFDAVGGELGRAAFAIVADGGRYSGHGMAGGRFFAPDPEEAERRGIVVRGIEQVRFSGTEPRRLELIRRALAAAAAGRIRPVIGQTFPLERAADAHRAMEERTALGKTLLLP